MQNGWKKLFIFDAEKHSVWLSAQGQTDDDYLRQTKKNKTHTISSAYRVKSFLYLDVYHILAAIGYSYSNYLFFKGY